MGECLCASVCVQHGGALHTGAALHAPEWQSEASAPWWFVVLWILEQSLGSLQEQQVALASEESPSPQHQLSCRGC